jgi:hypothetical protein
VANSEISFSKSLFRSKQKLVLIEEFATFTAGGNFTTVSDLCLLSVEKLKGLGTVTLGFFIWVLAVNLGASWGISGNAAILFDIDERVNRLFFVSESTERTEYVGLCSL